jgi:serine/threonine-protein kinase HipA
MKRFQQFGAATTLAEEGLELSTLIALNCAIRNGDAHLKNFAILYDDVEGDAHLAPAYDLITTTVYLPRDRMALTLNGTSLWPSAKNLLLFGEKRSVGAPKTLLAQMERIGDALSETARDVEAYMREHPEFAEIGRGMLEQWEIGRRESLSLK